MIKPLTVLLSALILSMPVQAQDWTGWYVGVEGSANLATRDHMFYSPAGDYPLSSLYSGASAGIVAGYMFDAGNVLVGIEAKAGLGGAGLYSNHPTFGHYSYAQRYYVSAQVKAAIPMGKFLPYLGVGIHAADVSNVADSGVMKNHLLGYGSSTGLMASLGTEMAITDALSFKVEYSAMSTATHLRLAAGDYERFAPQSSLNMGLNFRF